MTEWMILRLVLPTNGGHLDKESIQPSIFANICRDPHQNLRKKTQHENNAGGESCDPGFYPGAVQRLACSGTTGSKHARVETADRRCAFSFHVVHVARSAERADG